MQNLAEELERKILDELRSLERPITDTALRRILRVNNQRLGITLVELLYADERKHNNPKPCLVSIRDGIKLNGTRQDAASTFEKTNKFILKTKIEERRECRSGILPLSDALSANPDG